LRARYIAVYVHGEPLFPTLRFMIELERVGDEAAVWILGGSLNLETPKGIVKVAELNRPIYRAFSNPEERIFVDFVLDPWRLEKLEELREGKDLRLRINLHYHEVSSSGLVEPDEKSILVVDEKYGEGIKVAKSEWIDEFLPGLGLRRVRLIEVPVLEPIPDEFKDVVGYVEEAWKCYLRGDYDDAIANCRRSLIAVDDAVRKMGYEKYEVDEKSGERRVPDWKKLFGHETLAENFEKTFRGCFGFTQPGSHAGRAITRKEAEYAIYTTHSIVNFIVKAITKS